MLISTSFLSSKNIPQDLTKLNETDTDYIHVDVMDGKFVKNKSLPFSEMKNIYKYTDKRLDVHLMVEKPMSFIEKYATLNAEYITIHLELAEDIEKLLNYIKEFGIKSGIAINPSTPVKDLVPYLPLVDLVIVMSVVPGAGGQAFIEETPAKIRELRTLLKEYNSKALICVDGGINDKTKDLCQDADILVSGSFILNGEDYQNQINMLRK